MGYQMFLVEVESGLEEEVGFSWEQMVRRVVQAEGAA